MDGEIYALRAARFSKDDFLLNTIAADFSKAFSENTCVVHCLRDICLTLTSRCWKCVRYPKISIRTFGFKLCFLTSRLPCYLLCQEVSQVCSGWLRKTTNSQPYPAMDSINYSLSGTILEDSNVAKKHYCCCFILGEEWPRRPCINRIGGWFDPVLLAKQELSTKFWSDYQSKSFDQSFSNYHPLISGHDFAPLERPRVNVETRNLKRASCQNLVIKRYDKPLRLHSNSQEFINRTEIGKGPSSRAIVVILSTYRYSCAESKCLI